MRSLHGWGTLSQSSLGNQFSGSRKAWTDGRHADDKCVELDELAVALANVTEGAARSTVLKVTQAEPSHGSSAAAHSCDTQKVKGRIGIEGEAHSIIESG